MTRIQNHKLSPSKAPLWWLGQPRYAVLIKNIAFLVGRYLSAPPATNAPYISRLYPPPIAPSALIGDIYNVTYDHPDHLDPELIYLVIKKDNTQFIAPRQIAKKFLFMGTPENRITNLHARDHHKLGLVELTGFFTLPMPTGASDTTGYFVKLNNRRNVYHPSDTELHRIVQAEAPSQPEILFSPINGKRDNPGSEQTFEFIQAIQPKYVLPNNYNLMKPISKILNHLKGFVNDIGFQAALSYLSVCSR